MWLTSRRMATPDREAYAGGRLHDGQGADSCLLTCIKELNQPRYMSVNGIFTCYDKPMEVFDYNALKDDPLIEVDTIGLKGSPTNVFKSFTPPQKGAGTMLKGDDTAAQLAGILAKKHLI